MQMLLYLPLAAVIYGFLAERTDRAVEREMRRRRGDGPDLRLVDDPGPGGPPSRS